ncbi:DUF6000 family protein [Kribbella sp. HUAS MG21]|uniref:DUF6000 family protein n=1 Tax=Kribbella sp. HUAS MG21 TaxID=3160966 RepID=A0AAU7TNS3_9ACTN
MDDFNRAYWAMTLWAGSYRPLIVKAWLWPRPRQAWYQFRLRTGGRLAPAKHLNLMLDSGWRTSVAAIWLIAAGQRADLRPRIERDMLAGRPRGHGWSYCTPLASLGTEADARILSRYLEHALTLPVEPEGLETQCQGEALATLRYLDEQLGTTYAQCFLDAWERWPGSATEDLAGYRKYIEADVVFAAGGNPGWRREMKAQRRPTGPV